jgi:exodeoxyribonuclease-3
MRIISYNVNGICAAISKGFISGCKQANPDVICLSGNTPEQIPLLDFELAGYPYHYWFPATKKGYSGTILSKIKPNNVFYGTGIEHMDFEGRNIRLDFDALSVMSLYLPSGTNAERLGHKFMYMDDFQNYIN